EGDRELPGRGLEHSSQRAKERDLESELCCIHSRSLRQWLSAFRKELGEVERRRLLQSSAPRSRTHCVEDSDVSREGRSLHSLAMGQRLPPKPGNTAKAPHAGR